MRAVSGKPKGPATPEEEREQLRQLTRELHEAAQDARDAEKRLRAARREIATETVAAIEAMVDLHQEELARIIRENYAAVQRTLEEQEQHTREHYAELLGRDGADLIARTCGMILHLTVPAITADGWVRELSAIAAQHERTGCTCTGCLVMTKAAADGAGGAVLAATADGLAEYIAAGGDPGVVIDAR